MDGIGFASRKWDQHLLSPSSPHFRLSHPVCEWQAGRQALVGRLMLGVRMAEPLHPCRLATSELLGARTADSQMRIPRRISGPFVCTVKQCQSSCCDAGAGAGAGLGVPEGWGSFLCVLTRGACSRACLWGRNGTHWHIWHIWQQSPGRAATEAQLFALCGRGAKRHVWEPLGGISARAAIAFPLRIACSPGQRVRMLERAQSGTQASLSSQ